MAAAARATLVATLTEPPDPSGQDLARLSPEIDVLEVRGDLVGDLDAAWLRQHGRWRLLFTLRSRAEGGEFEGSSSERSERLARAARAYDLVDLEGVRDRDPRLLGAVEPPQRIVSWHGPASDLVALRECFAQLSTLPAALYKLVPGAEIAGEELAPLALLRSLQRPDVAAFASGRLGAWSRLVAPRLGAPWIYGAVGTRPGAPGQPTLARLVQDYGLPELPPVEGLCGVIGDPVEHSLSPRLHNALYRALGLPLLYVPLWVPSFGDFWLEVVESGSLDVLGVPWRGFSVTAPHKDAALAVAGAASPLAERLASANTLIHNGEVWEAEATDPGGVVEPLRGHGVALAERRAAVLGAGGAARAAAVGLALEGAAVELVHRGSERSRAAVALLRMPAVDFADFDPAAYDVIVNATPLGRRGELPFDPARLRPGAAFVDMAYGEAPTPAVEAARALGRLAIDGREVLLEQARRQFVLMTGQDAPLDVARRALGLEAEA